MARKSSPWAVALGGLAFGGIALWAAWDGWQQGELVHFSRRLEGTPLISVSSKDPVSFWIVLGLLAAFGIGSLVVGFRALTRALREEG